MALVTGHSLEKVMVQAKGAARRLARELENAMDQGSALPTAMALALERGALLE